MLNAGPLQITELMAVNDTALRNAFLAYEDWIEIHNPGETQVVLDGWFLTDARDDLTKWEFQDDTPDPELILQPGEYIVVFASERDLNDPAGELHTNFKLRGDGDYLALAQPDGLGGVTISYEYSQEYPYEFPAQGVDVAYGLLDGQERFLPFGTPGKPNDFPFAVITEFMANNTDTLQDEDGDYSDWIEIHNPTDVAVNLDGWHLKDAQLDWTFPAVVLPPYEYLIVFASGKDRREPFRELHTNFALKAGSGEYLGLVQPDGVTAWCDYYPRFKKNQQPDVSYGYLPTQERGFMATATPGQPNVTVDVGLTFTVDDAAGLTAERGFYNAAFDLWLTVNPRYTTIYYTTDGSKPEPANPAAIFFDPDNPQQGPIPINTTTTLRVATEETEETFQGRGYRQISTTHTYIFLADVLAQPDVPEGFPESWPAADGHDITGDYEMDPRVVTDPRYAGTILTDLKAIPTISLVMDYDDLFGPENGIYTHTWEEWEKPVSVEMFEMVDNQNRTLFQTNSGVEIHGGISENQDFTKKQTFRLEFKPKYGDAQLDYPLFGEGADDSLQTVVLRAGSSDSWAMRGNPAAFRETYLNDRWAADTQSEMGGLAPHGTWVHLYVNGLYWGLYNPVEQPTKGLAEKYLGGSSGDYNVFNHTTYQFRFGSLRETRVHLAA